MDRVRFNAGDVILSEGEEGDSAYLIVSGAVEVTVEAGGVERTLATLKDGDVFGEMSLIEPGPRSATVTAVSDVECARTSYADFMSSMRDNPEQAMEFMKVLVLRLRRMNEMMASMDPRKRTMMNVFRDWAASIATPIEELSDEERELQVLAVMNGLPHV